MIETLLNFLDRLKNRQDVDIPVYSHEVYDIVPGGKQRVKAADFVIVEGINVFQNPQNERLYITDFFDFSIYVDAAVDDIESWYLDRFLKLLSFAQNDPDSYYHRLHNADWGKLKPLHQVWTSILSQIYKIILNRHGIVPKSFSTKLKTMKSMKFT